MRVRSPGPYPGVQQAVEQVHAEVDEHEPHRRGVRLVAPPLDGEHVAQHLAQRPLAGTWLAIEQRLRHAEEQSAEITECALGHGEALFAREAIGRSRPDEITLRANR